MATLLYVMLRHQVTPAILVTGSNESSRPKALWLRLMALKPLNSAPSITP